MRHAHCRKAAGFTLVQLLIVVAIVAIIMALALRAVQYVRMSAARTQCINNMQQLALGVLNFHDRHDRFPTYNGIFPAAASTDASQGVNKNAIYGSYLLHTLPYIEQQAFYQSVKDEVAKATNTGRATGYEPGTPGSPGGPIIKQATYGNPAVYDYSGLNYVQGIPATYKQWNAVKVSQDYYAPSPQSQNGAIIWVKYSRDVPDQFPDPGTGIDGYWANSKGVRTDPKLISNAVPATDAVYGPPGPPTAGSPGRNLYSGIFKAEVRGKALPMLICPSDPSVGDPNALRAGEVYSQNGDRSPWASTNYLANWNVISTGNAARGYKAPPRQKESINDGFSNTVLMAEAYSWCDGIGRTAYVAWHENDPTQNVPNGGMAYISGVHNFGLTYALSSNKIQAGNRPEVKVTAPNGYPNPFGSPELIFEYQVMPKPLSVANCPQGADCCNALSVQSGHPGGINIAMADGSVRTLRPGIRIETWRCLMLPSDGKAIQGDW